MAYDFGLEQTAHRLRQGTRHLERRSGLRKRLRRAAAQAACYAVRFRSVTFLPVSSSQVLHSAGSTWGGNENGDPTYALGRSAEEHQRLTEQAAFFRPMTERLFCEAGVGQGMRVLDVGSGAGAVAFLVSELVGPTGEIVGIDLDGSALEKARERARLLGLSNVTFVEGDVRDAELAGEFDAAVGRLVLLYFADPVDGLSAIVGRIRSGGFVVFQEMDMNPDISTCSYPEESLWSETGRTIVQTFAGAGVRVRMGRLLLKTFLGAGLPVPSLKEEVAVGGGPDFPGYSWITNSMRSLAPLAEKLGIARVADLDLDSLADRIRDDAVARELMVWTGPLVGAYARRS